MSEKEWTLVVASGFEIGLLHNGKPCRTWFLNEFGEEPIDLDHPMVKQAMEIQNALEKP